MASACSTASDQAQQEPVTSISVSTLLPPAPTTAPRPTSRISTEGGGQTSDIQVQVERILTSLDARASSEGTVITLEERVLFDFNRADLKPEATAALQQVAEVLRFYATAPASIRGHTDSIGSDAYNDDLSRRRALAVRSHLVDTARIDAARLEAVGLGKRQPVAPNTRPDGSDDPAGRQTNRRVEIVIQGVRR